MIEIFKKYDIELEKNEIEQFKKFLDIFIEKNKQINLSSIREKNDIIEKHFIDSIILNIFLEIKWNIADIWTWWWFPLIPLAITNPSSNFTWIDSIWKKLKAINEFSINLWLNNIQTLKWRVEEIWQDKKYRESFDIVISRATAYLSTLLEYSIPLLKIWWLFIAYKLEDEEELKSIKNSLRKLNSKILKIKKYTLWWQKRTFIFIEKIAKTNDKYPRKVWIPSKDPL